MVLDMTDTSTTNGDNVASGSGFDDAVAALAQLSTTEYEMRRKNEAARPGGRVTALDRHVEAARARMQDGDDDDGSDDEVADSCGRGRDDLSAGRYPRQAHHPPERLGHDVPAGLQGQLAAPTLGWYQHRADIVRRRLN